MIEDMRAAIQDWRDAMAGLFLRWALWWSPEATFAAIEHVIVDDAEEEWDEWHEEAEMEAEEAGVVV